MRRFLILLVLALAAGLYFEESRNVIFDRARPLLRPAQAWMTNQELRQIVDDLGVHQESRGGLPTRRGEFDEWMAGRYPQENSRVDAWGTPYQLMVTSTHYRVISAGPDRIFQTPDDLMREGLRQSGTRSR